MSVLLARGRRARGGRAAWLRGHVCCSASLSLRLMRIVPGRFAVLRLIALRIRWSHGRRTVLMRCWLLRVLCRARCCAFRRAGWLSVVFGLRRLAFRRCRRLWRLCHCCPREGERTAYH